jgi:hypothetical protein
MTPVHRCFITTAIVTALWGLGLAAAVSPAGSAEPLELEDLSGVAELARAFDEDRGKPRIVLLLSPT